MCAHQTSGDLRPTLAQDWSLVTLSTSRRSSSKKLPEVELMVSDSASDMTSSLSWVVKLSK